MKFHQSNLSRAMDPPRPRPGAAANTAAYTLTELVVAMALGAVVAAAGMAGVVGMQKSFAAVEHYGQSMADQARVMDYLSMDLRRARNASRDADSLGLTLTLPYYYQYAMADTAGQNPRPVVPEVDAERRRAVYDAAAAGTGAVPQVFYRFTPEGGVLRRRETFANGVTTPWQTVASGLNAFPTLDPADPSGAREVRVSVSFRPTFRLPNTPDNNLITLHNLIYLRNR